VQEVLDRFRHPQLGRRILSQLIPKLEKAGDKLGRKPNLMEVCGTHTVSISSTGIRDLLNSYVNLKSGPGCPVCVTDHSDIDVMLALARQEGVILTTFGDMIRVPGTGGSLAEEAAEGADIRLVYSTLDAVKLAEENPHKDVIFLGIGFETTTPTVAAALQFAEARKLKNFLIYSVHKVVPPVMRVLLTDPEVMIDGFILPGHVSVITGRKLWDFVAEEYRCPASVVGFEAVDILLGINDIIDQILSGQPKVTNMYARAVSEEGNPEARRLVDHFFTHGDSAWRGMGIVPGSGTFLKAEFGKFHAEEKYPVRIPDSKPPRGCACGEVLKGKIWPYECPLFNNGCNPVSPVGPCMVSSEGACAAYYRYHRDQYKKPVSM
jgi:hydrogenase expression/formation protein HypD